jgi:hypothetical protein
MSNRRPPRLPRSLFYLLALTPVLLPLIAVPPAPVLATNAAPAITSTAIAPQTLTRRALALRLAQQLPTPHPAPERNYPPAADVAGHDPDATAIARSLKANLMSLDPDGKFSPDRLVTREEGFAAVVQLVGSVPLSAVEVDAALEDYTDAYLISAWARRAIANALKLGVLPQGQTQIRPKDLFAAADLDRALQRIGSLPRPQSDPVVQSGEAPFPVWAIPLAALLALSGTGAICLKHRCGRSPDPDSPSVLPATPLPTALQVIEQYQAADGSFRPAREESLDLQPDYAIHFGDESCAYQIAPPYSSPEPALFSLQMTAEGDLLIQPQTQPLPLTCNGKLLGSKGERLQVWNEVRIEFAQADQFTYTWTIQPQYPEAA